MQRSADCTLLFFVCFSNKLPNVALFRIHGNSVNLNMPIKEKLGAGEPGCSAFWSLRFGFHRQKWGKSLSPETALVSLKFSQQGTYCTLLHHRARGVKLKEDYQGRGKLFSASLLLLSFGWGWHQVSCACSCGGAVSGASWAPPSCKSALAVNLLLHRSTSTERLHHQFQYAKST